MEGACLSKRQECLLEPMHYDKRTDRTALSVFGE